MLENRKPRWVVAGLLLATTMAAAQQSQTPPPVPVQAATPKQVEAATTNQLPNAPISQPLKRFEMPDYSRTPKQWPNILQPYKATQVPNPIFDNAPRIEQLIQSGTLKLSLSDAITMALENNLDIAIARYNYPIADTDILRAKSGANQLLGVNTGLVQGTPGGGGTGSLGSAGSGAGGTTGGAGGVGSGTAGLVQSTIGAGPLVPQLDPTITGTFQYDDASNPTTSQFSPNTTTHTTVGDVSYNQGFVTGTTMSVGFNNNRVFNSNPAFSSFNPILNSNFKAQLTQHLLNGFGISNNNRFIRIAKNNKKITDLAFEAQVITTVSQIEDIYWDLVNAYENVRVQQEAVNVAQRLLSDNKQQVEIGTLAPISVVQAQSQLATGNQNLIVAQTNLQLQQYLMLNAVARNVSNKMLANVPVVPTDRMDMAKYTDQNLDSDQLTELALKQSPALLQSIIDFENRDISRKAARNALLPSLDLFAFYGGSSVAGQPVPCDPLTSPFPCPTVPPPTGGLGTNFSNLFTGAAPDKGVGVNLSIPILNRAAQAEQIRADLETQQAQLRLQQLKNQIIVNIKSAVFTVTQDRAQVDAARSAQDYATQNLDAEQKKYKLGASTSYNVMTLQNALTQSEQTLLTAVTAYEKARVSLDLQTNQTLNRYGIQMADAVHGEVTKSPTVPGVAPSQNTTPTPSQQQQQQQQQQPANPK